MTPARLDYYRSPNYLTWIRAEASEINGDGCSGVTGIRVECCHQHDCEFFYAADAHDAYRLHKAGRQHPWKHAKPVTFDQANAKFRRCLQARSVLGRWSLMAVWRWLGVKWCGKSAWEAHRERERQAAV